MQSSLNYVHDVCIMYSLLDDENNKSAVCEIIYSDFSCEKSSIYNNTYRYIIYLHIICNVLHNEYLM